MRKSGDYLTARSSQSWLRRVLVFPSSLRGFIGVSAILLPLLFFGLVLPEVNRPVVKIELATVPKSIIEAGFSDAAIAQRIIQEIGDIDASSEETGSARQKDGGSSKQRRAFRGGDEKELPDLDLPGTKLSTKVVIGWLREVFHNAPTRIAIHVTQDGVDAKPQATVVTTYPNGVERRASVPGRTSHFPELIRAVAETVLLAIDPSKYALHLWATQADPQRMQAVLQECIDGADVRQKAQCLVTWGDILFDSGHAPAAEDKYREALRWAGNSAAAASGLANIAAWRGDRRQAIQHLRQALLSEPGARSLHLNVLGLARDAGEWPRAEYEAKAAADAGVAGIPALLALADIYTFTNRDELAKKAVLEAIDREPRRAATYSAWARLLFIRGEHEAGFRNYETALRLSRFRKDGVLNDWGLALQWLGDFAGAAAKHAEAVRLRPQDARFRVNLAADLAELGRWTEAVQQLEEAARIEPQDVAVLAFWGTACAKARLCDAIEKWTTAIKMAPSLSWPHNEWGNWLSTVGDYEQAASKHAEAVRLSPNDDVLRINLATDLMELQDFDQAESQLREALRTNPRSWVALSNWGRLLAQRGDLAGAEGKWLEALALNRMAIEPYLDWGYWLASMGNYPAAAEKHRRAAELAPLNPVPRVALAADLIELRQLDEAQAQYRRALELNPAAQGALNGLGRLLALQGDNEGAQARWREAMQRHPGSPEPYGEWGGWLSSNGDHAGAVQKYQEAMALAPASAWHRSSLASALMDSGAHDAAEQQFGETMRLSPRATAAMLGWARLRLLKDDVAGAMARWKKAIQLNPFASDPYMDWGNWLFSQGKFEEAAEKHARAAKLAPGNYWVHATLAATWARLGAHGKSDAEFQRAAELNPRATNHLLLWAEVLAQRGDDEGAKARWAEAVRVDPANPETHNNWAIWLYQKGDFAGATLHHARAVELKPASALFRTNLAVALMALDALDRAEAALAEAAKLDPNRTDTWTQWAVLRERRGDRSGAEAKRAVLWKLDPQAPDPLTPPTQLAAGSGRVVRP